MLTPVYRELHRRALTLHPFVALERGASAWWFNRFSPTMDDAERVRRRKIREQEWSLTARKSMATEMTLLEMACEEGFLEALRPRARRMAVSAIRARLGIFAVRERSGIDVTVEDVRTNDLLTLREHDELVAPEPGAVIVGRLYPIGRDRYMRSPGVFVFSQGSSPPAEELLTQTLILSPDDHPLSVALERMVSTVVLDCGINLPIDSPPAESRAKARASLNRLRRSIELAGMFERPESKGALWLEPSGTRPGRFTIFGWEADAAMAAWVEGLLKMGGIAREARRE